MSTAADPWGILAEVRALRAEVADLRSARADETLLDVEEVARLTGRTVGGIYRAVSRGTMPGAVKVGGRLRFRKSEIAK